MRWRGVDLNEEIVVREADVVETEVSFEKAEDEELKLRGEMMFKEDVVSFTGVRAGEGETKGDRDCLSTGSGCSISQEECLVGLIILMFPACGRNQCPLCTDRS